MALAQSDKMGILAATELTSPSTATTVANELSSCGAMLWMEGSPLADPLRTANPETSAVMMVSRRGLADPIARAATKLVAYYVHIICQEKLEVHIICHKMRYAHKIYYLPWQQ